MTAVRTYLLTVVAGALLAEFAAVFFPDGSQKKLVSFVGSLLLVLIVISPAASIKEFEMASVISKLQLNAEEYRTGIEVKNREIQKLLIEEHCEAYILDKAADMGADIRVTVYLSDLGAVPYPTGVRLLGFVAPDTKRRLTRLIEQELAIPEENQIWSVEE